MGVGLTDLVRACLYTIRDEIRLELRSTALWIVFGVTLVFVVLAAAFATTYLEAASRMGTWLGLLFPVAMGFAWAAWASRDRNRLVEEMEAATPTPAGVLAAGRQTGRLLVAFAMGLAVAALGTAAFVLLRGPRGLPSDLALVGYWAVAPLVLLWGASSFLGGLGGLRAYLGVLVLGAALVVLPGPLLPQPLLPVPTFPGLLVPLSETLITTGDGARAAAVHQAVCLALGFVLAAAAGRAGGRGSGWIGRTALSVLLLVALALSFPGWAEVRASAALQASTPGWVDRARLSPRWVHLARGTVDVWLAVADGAWRGEVAETAAGLLATAGGGVGRLDVVEVPDDRGPRLAGGEFLVPERTFRNGPAADDLRRRLVTDWVAAHMGPAAANVLYRDAIAIYVEWVLTDRLRIPGLPSEVAIARSVAETASGGVGTAPVLRLPDPADVERWTRRRGASGLRPDALLVAVSLWDRLGARPDPQTLVERAGEWVSEAGSLWLARVSSGATFAGPEDWVAPALDAFERVVASGPPAGG